MPQVSLNFSAASLAIAADGPRPRMNSELCRGSAPAISIQSQEIALAKCAGNSASAASSALSPVHSPRMASPATAEATKVLVAATLFSVPERMSIAWCGGGCQRRAGRVGDGDGQRAAVARGLRHRHDVGALARLRNGDAGRLRELQLGAVDRGDRRAERGDRHAGGKLDRIFQEGRGMVRRAARHGGEEARIERCGSRRRPRPRPRRPGRAAAPSPPEFRRSRAAYASQPSLRSFAPPARSISVRRQSHRYRRDISNA